MRITRDNYYASKHVIILMQHAQSWRCHEMCDESFFPSRVRQIILWGFKGGSEGHVLAQPQQNRDGCKVRDHFRP